MWSQQDPTPLIQVQLQRAWVKHRKLGRERQGLTTTKVPPANSDLWKRVFLEGISSEWGSYPKNFVSEVKLLSKGQSGHGAAVSSGSLALVPCPAPALLCMGGHCGLSGPPPVFVKLCKAKQTSTPCLTLGSFWIQGTEINVFRGLDFIFWMSMLSHALCWLYRSEAWKALTQEYTL